MSGYLSHLPTDVTSGLMRMSREIRIKSMMQKEIPAILFNRFFYRNERDICTSLAFIQLNLNLNTYISEPITREKMKLRGTDSSESSAWSVD